MSQSVQFENSAPSAGKFPLAAHDVHVWMAAIELPQESILGLTSWLSDDERQRAARFRHDRHRNKFIAARAMLRGVLARYIEAHPRDIAFAYLPHGKPELVSAFGAENLQFNLSHSGDVALCAVTRASAIGIDIEHIRELRDMQGLANRFFSPEEAAQLEREDEDQRLASFFRCWTRKEAYVKAIGEGITCPLDSFAVSFTANDMPRLVHIDRDAAIAATWSMVTIDPASEYVGALAMPGSIDSLRSWVWHPPELL